MATPDGRLGGESGASGSSWTFSLDTSGNSSAFTWAKGQWAPFRQEPLAKNTQGVCARPGLEVPAARGLAAPLAGPAAGGGAGGCAGPGAVAEGGVAPLGPAWFWVAAVSVAGAPVAAASVANAAPLVGGGCWGGPADSASAAIIAVQLAAISAQAPQSQISSPARAFVREAFGTSRFAWEPIRSQKTQNELAACKTLGLPIATRCRGCRPYASSVSASDACI